MVDVFISYKKERRAHAERLAALLEAYGYNVWWDYELAVGPDYRAQIEHRLDAAKMVLVLWCTGSVQSRFVRSEAGRADRRGKLCEAYLESVEAPVGFGEAQGARLVGWTGSPEGEGVAGLIRAIAAKTGREAYARTNVLRMLAQLPVLPALKPIRVISEDEAYPDERVAERRSGGQGGLDRSSGRGSGRGALVPIAAVGLTMVLLVVAGYGAWRGGWLDGAFPEVWTGRVTSGQDLAAVPQSDAGAASGVADGPIARMDPEAERLAHERYASGGMSLEQRRLYEEARRRGLISQDLADFERRLVGWASAAWVEVDQGNPEALRHFVAAYGGTSEAHRATARLAALDDSAWRRVTADGTVRSAQAYLTDFPESATPPGSHAADADKELAAHEAAVTAMQRALSAKGFYAGATDGQIGGRTASAALSFVLASGVDAPDLTLLDPAPILAFADRIERWEPSLE